MHRPHHERRSTMRVPLDEPVDAAEAERLAMRLVRELREQVARERETVRMLRDHLGPRAEDTA